MHPLFLVGHVLSWRERYVQNYVFAFCAYGWGLVLSTKLLVGKVCFYVFMFIENEPVDKVYGWYPSKYTIVEIQHRSYFQNNVEMPTYGMVPYYLCFVSCALK
jgi:hypothetical protein